MANLSESPGWVAGIYQLEESDPVQGGAEGIDNLQAKQLANRTSYLKQLVEAAGNNMTAHLAAADPHAQYATELWVAAQIAALLDSAPGALNTLNELAAALGDDPNFATTLTNLLAAKAPLSSPLFTDNPRAPTPAKFDNDTSLATTAFVKEAGLLSSGFIAIATSAAIGLNAVGGTVLLNSIATAITPTLPPANTVPSGCRIEFMNVNTGVATVSRAGADTIFVNNSVVTAFSVLQGDTLTLESNGINSWYAVGGSMQLGFSGAFGSSISASGYQKLPSGLIVLWGQANVAANTTTDITLPITPPNNFHQVIVSVRDSVASAPPTAYPLLTAIPISASSFRVRSYYTASALGISYIAIGQ